MEVGLYSQNFDGESILLDKHESIKENARARLLFFAELLFHHSMAHNLIFDKFEQTMDNFRSEKTVTKEQIKSGPVNEPMAFRKYVEIHMVQRETLIIHDYIRELISMRLKQPLSSNNILPSTDASWGTKESSLDGLTTDTSIMVMQSISNSKVITNMNENCKSYVSSISGPGLFEHPIHSKQMSDVFQQTFSINPHTNLMDEWFGNTIAAFHHQEMTSATNLNSNKPVSRTPDIPPDEPTTSSGITAFTVTKIPTQHAMIDSHSHQYSEPFRIHPEPPSNTELRYLSGDLLDNNEEFDGGRINFELRADDLDPGYATADGADQTNNPAEDEAQQQFDTSFSSFSGEFEDIDPALNNEIDGNAENLTPIRQCPMMTKERMVARVNRYLEKLSAFSLTDEKVSAARLVILAKRYHPLAVETMIERDAFPYIIKCMVESNRSIAYQSILAYVYELCIQILSFKPFVNGYIDKNLNSLTSTIVKQICKNNKDSEAVAKCADILMLLSDRPQFIESMKSNRFDFYYKQIKRFSGRLSKDDPRFMALKMLEKFNKRIYQ